MIEAERAELLYKAVDRLPEIQRRRFLLYYEYEFNQLIDEKKIQNKKLQAISVAIDDL